MKITYFFEKSHTFFKLYIFLFTLCVFFVINTGISYSKSDFCEIKPSFLYSGRTFVVFCYFESTKGKVIPANRAQVQWLDKSYDLYSAAKSEMVGYFGIPLNMDVSKVTTQNLKILLNGKTTIKTIYLRPHAYPLEAIHLQPQKEALTAPDKLNNESNVIGGFFRTLTGQKYWHKQFLLPAHGRISSEFGIRRDYYVGKKQVSQWQHRGVDIAAPAGTEIIAPASGKVILSIDFESHGGTIMIDHGWGVVSVFNHLKTRLVKTGALVSAGDVIASMGESGIATGSNVHWGLSVNGVRVDPLQWVEQSF